MMGRIACFVGAETLKGLSGCTGVPNAGEDEGIAEDEGGAGVLVLKMLAIGTCFRFGEIDGGGSIFCEVEFGIDRRRRRQLRCRDATVAMNRRGRCSSLVVDWECLIETRLIPRFRKLSAHT